MSSIRSEFRDDDDDDDDDEDDDDDDDTGPTSCIGAVGRIAQSVRASC